MLRVDGLRKTFTTDRGGVRAVEDVSFTVDEGRFFTLLGPSGCGKTTTLRCLAGLERPEAGAITLDERRLSGGGTFVPTHARDIGMVFQSYAIWPHMSVFENVAFPLRVAEPRPGKAEIGRAVGEALALVGLEGLEQRPAPQLSGGQQQRLALARALVRKPKLLLLDEPLSNLDAKLRQRMRIELRELQRRLRITTVYVTHDQGEALFLSHRVAVMQNGRIVQEGRPRDLYASPASGFVADFVGDATFVPGEVIDGGVRALGGTVDCTLSEALAPGEKALLVLRPERVVVRAAPSGAANEFAATLRVAAFLGDHLDCVVDVAGTELRARAHPTAELRREQRVWVELPPEHCLAIPDDGWRPRTLTRTFDDEET
ncbi:MAG TPA: ABC transporter ATP-binding protein [Candidatus Limnocylindria bacterium]|jgi:iron(III) transport system ATP-binding protein|nr:ABC transporter ATP-binding protein [Candidatus Limnocylindria bacterium]